MVINVPVPLEPQAMMDGGIVSVPLVIVGKAGGKVGSHETNGSIGIVEPNRNRTLVTGHPRHARLLDAAFHILDFPQSRSLNEDAQRSADELPAPKQNITFSTSPLIIGIERSLDGFLPQLLPRGITVHDLLRAELHDFLEADCDDFGLARSQFLRTQPWREVRVYALCASVQVECSNPPVCARSLATEMAKQREGRGTMRSRKKRRRYKKKRKRGKEAWNRLKNHSSITYMVISLEDANS